MSPCCELLLLDIGLNRLPVLLYLKNRLGLTQQEVKPFVLSLPQPIAWGGLMDCAHLASVLRDMGATVEVTNAPPLKPQRSVSVERILEVLTRNGQRIEDWFLIRVSGTDVFIPHFWHAKNGAMGCVVEDEELATACRAYLMRAHARRFQTWRHMMDTAAKEKWPGV